MSVVILECECIMHEAYQLPRDSVCATGNTAAKTTTYSATERNARTMGKTMSPCCNLMTRPGARDTVTRARAVTCLLSGMTQLLMA